MKSVQWLLLHTVTLTMFIHGLSPAQEFSVAAGTDTTWSGGAVFGGATGIVAVQGNATSQYTINAQIVNIPNQLVGERISLGDVGAPPGAAPFFDGTNYLLIWVNFQGDLKGHFLSTSGAKVGTAFTIASNVSLTRMVSYSAMYSGSSYLVAFIKDDGYLYGQMLGTNGSLIGGQFQISTSLARDFSVEFDGTNYFVVWVEVIPDTDRDVSGQFVSKAGALVGSNFRIDSGSNYSDNPTSVAFDGSRYLVVFHEMIPFTNVWSIKGTFVTPAGAVQESITIADTAKAPTNSTVAFDGSHYLATYTQTRLGNMVGCYFTTTGTPVGQPFEIFEAAANKFPLGGVGFGGGLYLAVATRRDADNPLYGNGDVYARFIQPLTSVNEIPAGVPERCVLCPNYPNPFNPSTTIRYALPQRAPVKISIMDQLGREVAVLVDEEQDAGYREAVFHAEGLASGVYYCRIQTGRFAETRSLLLIR